MKWLPSSLLLALETFVSHANAAPIPRARLRLGQLVVERGWTHTTAAKMVMVSPRTASKWAEQYCSRSVRG